MAKRKRGNLDDGADPATAINQSPTRLPKTNGLASSETSPSVIQIIAGSYERVLHGITASISNLDSASESIPSVQFADSFLFNAHASAIRCLALSPLPDPTSNANSQGVLLATGGSDERINVYSLSASTLSDSSALPPMPTLGKNKVSEHPLNRELGSILQHSSNITALYFPTRAKLISASEDNTIAITRVKDLNVVSSIKAPRPKAVGQPSGDTAPQGTTPAGVNDFAVHPSLKLMLSVGTGERCMRLWNLVTGKKAGVLNFSREVLQSVKESKHSSGEGRRIRWNQSGTEFAVAFERGVIVFGEDSRPKCKVLPSPSTKIHQISFITLPDSEAGRDLLAASTEDGRIVFYNTNEHDERVPANGTQSDGESSIPEAKCLGQLGGKSAGILGRIKDFEVLTLQPLNSDAGEAVIVITASSDGTVRLWHLSVDSLGKDNKGKDEQLGRLLGSYATGNRITCLKAFVMLPPTEEDGGFSEFEGLSETAEESSSEESEVGERNGK